MNATLAMNPDPLRDAREEAARRILAAAVVFQTEHRARLNVSNPRPHTTPAPKGDYPRKRVGFLQANVLVTPTSLAEIVASGSVRVGYGAAAFYGNVLAAKGWKGLLDTLDDLRPRLAAVMAGSGSVGGVS